MNVPGFKTVNETAEILGITRFRVNKLVRSGKLVAEKLGRMYLISEESIEKRLYNPPKNSKINKESPWRDR